jgi:protein gp37
MNPQRSPGGIEWTRVWGREGFTSNPIRGCLHGCKWRMPNGKIAICYAKMFADDHRNTYPLGFENLTFHPEVFDQIKRRKKPAGIFIDSMSDLFGRDVKPEWIQQVLVTIRNCPQHVFFSLTKNAGKMAQFSLPTNLWAGVSAPPTFMFGKEMDRDARINWYWNSLKHLVNTNATIRWTSIEPLSEDFSDAIRDFEAALDWAVIGAATDHGCHHQPDEVHLRRTVEVLGDTPIFFKGNLNRELAEYVCGKWRQEFPPEPPRPQEELAPIFTFMKESEGYQRPR